MILDKMFGSTLANPSDDLLEALGGRPTMSGMSVNADTALREKKRRRFK